jgi:spermidine/putrescine ABC transporter substrate binding protein
VLRENIYSLNNVNSSYDNLLKQLTLKFFNELRKNITNQEIKKEIIRWKEKNNLTHEESSQQINKFINLLESNDIQNENKILNFRNAGLFESIFSKTFSNSNIGEILNFDYISYTPTDNVTFKFIEK